MKERNFTPKIKKSDKYKDQIKMTFEERRLKSIELKNKYKNAKNENININNTEGILSPGEMVRFIEDKNNIKENNDEFNNNFNNEELNKNLDIKINNIEDEKEIVKSIDVNKYDNNFPTNKANKNEIEKNRILMMDKIKGEHKIGFKFKKDNIKENEVSKDEENKNENTNNKENKENVQNKEEIEVIKIEENYEIEEDLNSIINNPDNKKAELSFNSNNFHSTALKEILNKNKNDK